MADITKEQVIEFIKQMSVLELSEMVKEMEEIFGVSAAAVAGAAGAFLAIDLLGRVADLSPRLGAVGASLRTCALPADHAVQNVCTRF